MARRVCTTHLSVSFAEAFRLFPSRSSTLNLIFCGWPQVNPNSPPQAPTQSPDSFQKIASGLVSFAFEIIFDFPGIILY